MRTRTAVNIPKTYCVRLVTTHSESHTTRVQLVCSDDDDDDAELHVLGCRLTYIRDKL